MCVTHVLLQNQLKIYRGWGKPIDSTIFTESGYKKFFCVIFKYVKTFSSRDPQWPLQASTQRPHSNHIWLGKCSQWAIPTKEQNIHLPKKKMRDSCKKIYFKHHNSRYLDPHHKTDKHKQPRQYACRSQQLHCNRPEKRVQMKHKTRTSKQ